MRTSKAPPPPPERSAAARVAAWPSFPWKNPTLSAGAHVRSSRRQFSRRLAGATTSAGSFTGAPLFREVSFWLATSAASALVFFVVVPTDAHPPTPFSFRRREHARYATVCAVFPRPISSARIAPGTSCSSSNSRKLTPIIWYGLSDRARDVSPATSKTSSAVTSARDAGSDRFEPPGDKGPSRRATSRPSASRRRREICAHRASAASSGSSAYASESLPAFSIASSSPSSSSPARSSTIRSSPASSSSMVMGALAASARRAAALSAADIRRLRCGSLGPGGDAPSPPLASSDTRVSASERAI